MRENQKLYFEIKSSILKKNYYFNAQISKQMSLYKIKIYNTQGKVSIESISPIFSALFRPLKTKGTKKKNQMKKNRKVNG